MSSPAPTRITEIHLATTKAEIISLVRRSLAVAIVVTNLLAGTDAALAHAILIETEPVSQASLATPPSEIVLVFSEAVTPVFLRLLDIEGKAIAEIDDMRGNNSRLNLPLQSGRGSGSPSPNPVMVSST